MTLSASTRHPNLKVFLVEDNPDMREILTLQLESDGFDVHAAATMQAALREFPLFGSEILLSDLGLPDGDGWQLLRALRGAGLAPYAIAMSGFGTLSDIAASRDAGFRHHLVKPIDLDALERLLDEATQEVKAVQ